jgi:hypothetical protein
MENVRRGADDLGPFTFRLHVILSLLVPKQSAMVTTLFEPI